MRNNLRNDLHYVELMIVGANNIQDCMKDLEIKDNRLDDAVKSLIILNLEQISSQLSEEKLSENIREEYCYDWEALEYFKNFISRHYNNINSKIILGIAYHDVPELLEVLYQIKQDLLKELEE